MVRQTCLVLISTCACIANNNHKRINFAVIIIYRVMDTAKK